MAKNDVTISLAMLSDEQRQDVEEFSARYGFSVAGFMRYCTLKVINDELKPQLEQLPLETPKSKPIPQELKRKEEVADTREKGGVPRVQDPRSQVSRSFTPFNTNRPSV